MPSITTHVIPTDGGWLVKKERDVANRAPSKLYLTQKAALEAARSVDKPGSVRQIVVHRRDGSIRLSDLHGLPKVQPPPRKSDLGTKAIERAVSKVIRERL